MATTALLAVEDTWILPLPLPPRAPLPHRHHCHCGRFTLFSLAALSTSEALCTAMNIASLAHKWQKLLLVAACSCSHHRDHSSHCHQSCLWVYCKCNGYCSVLLQEASMSQSGVCSTVTHFPWTMCLLQIQPIVGNASECSFLMVVLNAE